MEMDRYNNSNSKREPAVFPPHKSRLPVIKAKMVLADELKSDTDVLGSYTGVSMIDEYPEQDADDL